MRSGFLGNFGGDVPPRRMRHESPDESVSILKAKIYSFHFVNIRQTLSILSTEQDERNMRILQTTRYSPLSMLDSTHTVGRW